MFPDTPNQEDPKGRLKIILPLVLLVALGVGGYFVLIKPTRSDYKIPAERATTTVSTQSLLVEQISGWQTYTDNAIGVSVKFPKDWYVYTASGLPGSFSLINISPDDYENPAKWDTSAGKNVSSFYVRLRAFDNKLSIDQWYKSYFVYPPEGLVSSGPTTVAGLPAIRVLTKNNYYGVDYSVTHYFVAKGGHVIEVGFDTEQLQYLDTYNTIVENLKLFEIIIPPGSYKISKNNIYLQSIQSIEINDKARFTSWNNFFQAVEGHVLGGELILTSTSGIHFPVSAYVENLVERITGVYGNPLDTNSVFISSSDFGDNSENIRNSSCINKLFSYNLKTGELVEFYSETSKNNSPMAPEFNCRILRIVGTQGSKLITLIDDPENSPGPCTSIWSDYRERFLYIDLADINSGLKKFVVPKYKIDTGEQQVRQCLESFERDGGI
ncbi:MAG: hypothetical protein WBL19_02360 [Minisyncoccia bacterium]